MAQTALVGSEVEGGRALLNALDEAGVPVRGAFWFYYPELDRWKLIVVSPDAERGARDLYLKAIDLKPALDLALVEFTPPSSPIFKALSGLMRIDGASTVRMSQNMLNGVYVEDALIYRLAA
jgi:hypothetical protein